jgi:hypothetical protein
LLPECQFQLRGIAFRIVGVTVGSREAKSFAVRFLDTPMRRRQELAEVLEEVAAANATKETAPSAVSKPAPAPVAAAAKISIQVAAQASKPILEPVANPGISASAGKPALVTEPPGKTPEKTQANPPAPKRPAERRSRSRHAVDTSATLLLIKTAISMPGHILNLSLGGCRIRADERFNVGIYVRVEAEFDLHGLPFRVGGVSQAILDQNTIGVRFIDRSERRRNLPAGLIAEIAEAAREPAAGLAEIVDEAGNRPAAGQPRIVDSPARQISSTSFRVP